MKFKDMTSEDKEFFTKVYRDKNLTWDERMQILMKYVGKSERTVRKWFNFVFYKNFTYLS